jgi:tetratricopeptide (TPR) repeat protein
VDYLIGMKLSQHYRFAESAEAERQSLALDPDYLPAQRQLAEDLLRLGQIDEGWRLAQAVQKTDPYDVTAFNLATLHDQMAKFRLVTNENFVLHMSPLEAQVYGEDLLKLLSKARETLCAKYGVTLTRPTVVEIFPQQKDFAVATFGMPGNPGYLGVCFGSVITANSPASQAPDPANWEDVLWHEFCHVVTLTATRNRMPRWFSEGISVYEERQANPAWGARMNLANREFILNGGLTPLGQLSSAFLTPTNNDGLQFAYYESSLVIEFVVQKYGMDALKNILGDLGRGIEMNAAISGRTAPLPDLEKQFAAYAKEKAEALAPGADIEKPKTASSAAGEAGGASPSPRSLAMAGGPGGLDPAWAAAHTNNYYLQMLKAEELMSAKDWADAEPLLGRIAAAYHGESKGENPLWLLAVAQRNLKEDDAELATLQKFAEQESDFVDLYQRLIEIERGRKDWGKVSDYASRLLAINPLTAQPYLALAEAGAATGQADEAISADRKLLLLDPPDPAGIHYQLARLLHERGNAEADAKRNVLEALEDAPRYREAQRLLLEIVGATNHSAAAAPARE